MKGFHFSPFLLNNGYWCCLSPIIGLLSKFQLISSENTAELKHVTLNTQVQHAAPL